MNVLNVMASDIVQYATPIFKIWFILNSQEVYGSEKIDKRFRTFYLFKSISINCISRVTRCIVTNAASTKDFFCFLKRLTINLQINWIYCSGCLDFWRFYFILLNVMS